MSYQSHKLTITNPCDNDWNEMLPVQNGRHCSSYNKNVVDFSVLTDEEIIQFFATNQDIPVCGRFYKNQIDTIRIELQENLLYTNISSWKKFLIIFLVCFGYQLFSIQFTLAQTEAIDTTIQNTDTINIENDTSTIIKTDSLVDSNEHFLINIDSSFLMPTINIDGIQINIPTMGNTIIELINPSIILGDVCTSPIQDLPFPTLTGYVSQPQQIIEDNWQHPKKEENMVTESMTQANENNLPSNNKEKGNQDENKQDMLLVNNAIFNRKRRKKKENR